MRVEEVTDIKISITITDNETGDVVVKEDYDSFRRFRLLLFDNGGIRFLGGLRPPIKAIKKPLRDWARESAAKQDLAGFLQALRHEAVEWAVKQGNTDVQHFVGGDKFRFDPEQLLTVSRDIKGKIEMSVRREYPGRDGTLVFNVLWEMLLAMVRRLKQENQGPDLHWEIESLPNDGGIYRILLEGGRDENGVHNN